MMSTRRLHGPFTQVKMLIVCEYNVILTSMKNLLTKFKISTLLLNKDTGNVKCVTCLFNPRGQERVTSISSDWAALFRASTP